MCRFVSYHHRRPDDDLAICRLYRHPRGQYAGDHKRILWGHKLALCQAIKGFYGAIKIIVLRWALAVP